MMSEFNDFRSGLEAKGVDTVRKMLSQRVWNQERAKWASDWVKEKEAADASSHQAATFAQGKWINIATWVGTIAAVMAAIFAALTYFR